MWQFVKMMSRYGSATLVRIPRLWFKSVLFFLQSGPDFAQKSRFLTHFSVCWLTHWHSGPKLRGGEGGPGVSRVSGRSINSTLLTKIPNSYCKSSIVFIQNPAQPQLVLLSMVLACSVHDILEFFVARSCSWFSFWLSCSLGQDLGLCIYTLAGRGEGGAREWTD